MEEERRRRSREGTEWITDRRRNGWNGEEEMEWNALMRISARVRNTLRSSLRLGS